MKTLLIIGVLFCVYKIVSGLSVKRKEQEQERQEEQRQAEAQRMREEWRRTQAEARLAIQRQEAMYREQERQRKEQERQAKEQVRLAKEQERQAAVLERHEAEIRKAQFTADQALSDIDFQKDRLADLESQLDYLLLLQAGTIPGSKEHDKYQKRIVTLHNQIHTAENKLNRAKFQHSEAERKLA